MKQLCIIGGGRWARLLLQVSHSLRPNLDKIYLVTRHNKQIVRSLVEKSGYQNVEIVDDLPQTFNSTLGGIIVATSPSQHYSDTMSALNQKYNVFCEKPFALTHVEALKLIDQAKISNCAFGVNLEFMTANYISELAIKLQSSKVRNISIVWHDPISEERHAEKKYGDISTSIAHDHFPHCWSILKTLSQGASIAALSKVDYTPESGLHIELAYPSFTAQVSCFRYAPERKRIISINNGEIELNFSTEPGLLQSSGKTIQNQWAGARPLSIALNSYFEVIEKKTNIENWKLSADANLECVTWAEKISIELNKIQIDIITKLARLYALPEIITDSTRLLIDTCGPILAMSGEKYTASEDDQKKILAHITNVGLKSILRIAKID